MPSPFPGMDPYLESPGIWPDFHDALAGEIAEPLPCIPIPLREGEEEVLLQRSVPARRR